MSIDLLTIAIPISKGYESLGPVYKAQIALDQQVIVVDRQTIALSPGMSALAEVKTDQRRIIDFFISPVLRYRDEAFRER